MVTEGAHVEVDGVVFGLQLYKLLCTPYVWLLLMPSGHSSDEYSGCLSVLGEVQQSEHVLVVSVGSVGVFLC